MTMKSNKMVFLVVAVLLCGGIAAGVYIKNNLGRISTDNAYIEGRIHQIASKIPGTVKRVTVQDNQIVAEGDVLVEIEPFDYELKVKEAQANYDIRKATYEQADRDKARIEALYKEKTVPQERYENTLTAFLLAKAQLDAADAQLKTAERNVEYTKICAPSSGHVTKKSVEAGNQILPTQPLMAIVPDDMWVVANFKETELTDMRPGQTVEIRVDTYPGKVFTGRVDSIQRGTGSKFSMFPPENAAGNFVKVVQRVPVKIVFDGKPDRKYPLSTGMSVVPKIRVR